MKISSTISVSALLMASIVACNSSSRGGRLDTDSIATDSTEVEQIKIERLPDTCFASINNLVYEVINKDSVASAPIDINTDDYAHADGIFVFRGNRRRNGDMKGRVKGTPTRVEKVWTFYTRQPSSPANKWGSGSGWNGQPVYVHWSEDMTARLKRESRALTDDFCSDEIIVGSLAGHVYFINYENGKASRTLYDLINTVKGSVSLDPDFSHPTLYIGQGIPVTRPFGCMAIDLISHEKKFFHSDPRSWRSWGAFDSSPIVAGGYLFWPGENGTFSKFTRHEDGSITLHSALRFKRKGSMAPGIESSVSIYRNYGYFGDNRGNIMCVNLDTMRPVWHYDNHDDTDGTIVVDEENGCPVVYTGCEVDKQGQSGYCYFVKLNGLTGEKLWETKIAAQRWDTPDQHFDGGMYASPLLGKGDCEGLIFVPLCFTKSIPKGEFFAFNTADGSIAYRVDMPYYAWSSPVGFYNESDELFILQGDCAGNIYLIKGKTGEIIFRERMGHNFESSPVVRGNSAVVGTRGNEIYRFDVL